MSEVKIITRHRGVVAWLKVKGINGRVLSHAFPNTFQRGDIVYGILPISLIVEGLKRGAEINLLVLPQIPFELRGKELTAQMMDELGGVKVFRVNSLKLKEVKLKEKW